MAYVVLTLFTLLSLLGIVLHSAETQFTDSRIFFFIKKCVYWDNFPVILIHDAFSAHQFHLPTRPLGCSQ